MTRRAIAAALATVALGGGVLTADLLTTGGGGVDGAAPATCAFPTCFPDATNTGVPSGTSLTTYSGPTVITVDNTIIDSKTINSGLEINANNVTVRKSVINGPIDNSNHPTKTGLVVQDSELNCGGGDTGLWSHDMTVTRVNLHNCENGLSADDNITVQDSYIHDLAGAPGNPDPHIDGSQSNFSNITFEHNTIIAFDTSDINIYNGSGGKAHDILVSHNRLIMTDAHVGQYCPRLVSNGGSMNLGDGPASNIVITNNKMDNLDHSDFGDSCIVGDTIKTWSGNIRDDGTTVVNPS